MSQFIGRGHHHPCDNRDPNCNGECIFPGCDYCLFGGYGAHDHHHPCNDNSPNCQGECLLMRIPIVFVVHAHGNGAQGANYLPRPM